MTLDEYSIALSIALIALSIGTIASIISYFTSAKARAFHQKQNYFTYIKLIGVFAVIATIGALVYQFVYATPVCEFCWWQRIFMFPIDIIALLSVSNSIRGNESIIAVLAMIGGLIAAYHYYFHVQVAILGKILEMPCSTLGIVPSCTESPVIVFGFITIPLMALIVFLVILWLVFLSTKASKLK